jgi:hypothetical protein
VTVELSPPVDIWFDRPAPLLSMNGQRGREHSDNVRLWREAAYWAACQALPVGPRGRRRLTRSRVLVLLVVSNRVRRDPANFVATVKPIVDGFTDANLWPDDGPEWVTVTEPALLYSKPKPTREVMVRVEPAPIEAT